MTGLWIVLGALIMVGIFGLVRARTDGRRRPGSGALLDATRLGHRLGTGATLVQFSSELCAPCRATRRLLAELVTGWGSVTHVELDAEARLDLVEEFGILRTPTVLVLDADGAVRHRIVGLPRRSEVLAALGDLTSTSEQGMVRTA